MSPVVKMLAANAFHQVGEAMLVTDIDHRILDVNQAFISLMEAERESLIGQPASRFLSGQLAVSSQASGATAGCIAVEVICHKHGGRRSSAIASVTQVPGTLDEPGHHLIVVSDSLASAQLNHKIGREVYYDALTGLPNLQLLTQLVEEAIQQASRRGVGLAICSLDIDHFKRINDRHGQALGDSLVAAVAQRIGHHLHEDDILARVGGDEFVLLLHHGADDDTLARLLGIIREPFFIKGHRLQVTASLGVTFYPRDDATGDVLLRHAYQAMYRAKERGRNIFHLFDPNLDRATQDRGTKRRRFASALASGELRLYYQPQVDLFDGQVIGLEALIRWLHPERGLLAPDAFLSVLEGTELDIELGEWVLEVALQQLRTWQAQGITLPVSVNISPDHLLTRGFSRKLEALLERFPEIPARRLRLEILESAAMSDIQAALCTMRRCQALGIDFAIDDFGTGYSSLTILRQLPVDLIKIDQSFVRGMLNDPHDMAIVESVIYMAKRFRRPMLAEGVETLDHAKALLKLGCTQVQGYGIARPMPADELPGWLDQWTGQHEWSALFLQPTRPPTHTNT